MDFRKCLLMMGICFCSFSGCGKGKPEGIPDLHPVSVTVTKEGKPVDDVSVFLVATDAKSGSWSVTGSTNSSGVAAITTSQGDWKAKGAPEGKYKVYLTKVPKVDMEPPPPGGFQDQASAMAYAQERRRKIEAAPREIPDSLTTPARSDLTISVVVKTGAKETYDIGKYKFDDVKAQPSRYDNLK